MNVTAIKELRQLLISLTNQLLSVEVCQRIEL